MVVLNCGIHSKYVPGLPLYSSTDPQRFLIMCSPEMLVWARSQVGLVMNGEVAVTSQVYGRYKGESVPGIISGLAFS